MATISELMKDKKPGEIKISQPSWLADEYFVPFYQDYGWYGLSNGKISWTYSPGGTNWRLYQEPKKQETRWKWAYKGSRGWIESDYFYTEERATKELAGYKLIKLEYTATQFEEE